MTNDTRDPEKQIDPRGTTGAYHLARGRYGKRVGDKPIWWVICYHAAKAFAGSAMTLLATLLLALLFQRCGVPLPWTGH